MIKLLNRNSFTILSILILAAVWSLVGRSYGGTTAGAAVVVTGIILVLISRQVAHQAQPVEAGTAAEAASGKFTLVEYYSDY